MGWSAVQILVLEPTDAISGTNGISWICEGRQKPLLISIFAPSTSVSPPYAHTTSCRVLGSMCAVPGATKRGLSQSVYLSDCSKHFKCFLSLPQNNFLSSSAYFSHLELLVIRPYNQRFGVRVLGGGISTNEWIAVS